jgi:hypothetical protein
VLGRILGAGVLTFFGAIWYVLTILSIASRSNILLWSLPGAIVVAGLAVAAFRLARSAGAGFSSFGEAKAERARIRRVFGIVNAIQWLLIVAAIVLANVLSIPERIAAMIEIIVGVHFIPLGALFAARLYYATAAAMVLAGIASFMLQGGAAEAFAAGSAALILWVTAACVLAIVYRLREPRRA